jgi:predicted peptidase
VLAKSIVNLKVTADATPDIDPNRVHYVGLSLGGIVGLAQAKYAPNMRTVTVAAPGGLLSRNVARLANLRQLPSAGARGQLCG